MPWKKLRTRVISNKTRRTTIFERTLRFEWKVWLAGFVRHLDYKPNSAGPNFLFFLLLLLLLLLLVGSWWCWKWWWAFGCWLISSQFRKGHPPVTPQVFPRDGWRSKLADTVYTYGLGTQDQFWVKWWEESGIQTKNLNSVILNDWRLPMVEGGGIPLALVTE